MTPQNLSTLTTEELLVVENWPISVEASRGELKKARKLLERYQAVLRLANIEIERRNQGVIALTTFAYQTSKITTPVALLKLALVQALETVTAQVGAIILIDADTKELKLGVHKGVNAELARILTGRQLGQGATVLMPHLVTGSGALLEYHTSADEMERQLLAVSGLTSLVSLPLQFGPRLMGALLVGLQGKRTFKPADLYFLMAISQETTIALEGLRLREGLWHTAATLLNEEEALGDVELQSVEKADIDLPISTPFELPASSAPTIEPAEDDLEHLLAAMMEAEEEVQQQNADLQTMITLSEMMNQSLNLTEILQCAVEQTQVILKTDAAWIYLLGEKDRLDMRAYTGLSTAYVRGMQRLKAGDQIEGRAATKNKAQFIKSVDSYRHKIWVDREKLKAIAAVPITRPEYGQAEQHRSHVVGVLVAAKKGKPNQPWSPREMRLLTSIANQLAPVIDNARLYARIQEDEASLRAGNEVLQTVNDMLLNKNTLLEKLIQDDLIPILNKVVPLLQYLLTANSDMLTKTQKRNIALVQKVRDRLKTHLKSL